jgi:hypothetical protein
LTFNAVGTPASGAKIDLKYVEAAASEIGVALRHKPNYHTEEHGETRHDGRDRGNGAGEPSGKITGQGFGLGMNPEFSRRGTAVVDFSSFSEPDSCEKLRLIRKTIFASATASRNDPTSSRRPDPRVRLGKSAPIEQPSHTPFSAHSIGV